MNIYILASGSKGNVSIVENDNKYILIDNGISFRKLNLKLKENNIDIKKIKDLIITHEHSDHISGLPMILKRGNLSNLYMTRGTYNALSSEIHQLIENVNLVLLTPNEVFKLHNLEVNPIDVSHDAAEPIGLIFKNAIKKAVFLTDTGYVDRAHHEVLSNADFYLVEANHDPVMLLNSFRPHGLKQRIMGIHGHLSNDEAALLMNNLIQTKSATWVIAHISEDCNNQFSIEEAIVNNFDDPTKVKIHFSSQESLDKFEL